MLSESVKRSGRPPRLDVPGPARWEAPAVAKQLDDILAALEVPRLDTESRRTLQRLMHRPPAGFFDSKRVLVRSDSVDWQVAFLVRQWFP
jgi:hypothetical protein